MRVRGGDVGALDDVADLEHLRPRRRGHCAPGGPLRLWRGSACPWVSCRYNLAIDINDKGTLAERPPGCALDVADEGPHTLDEVGALLGRTRERVRQIEVRTRLRLVEALRRLDD